MWEEIGDGSNSGIYTTTEWFTAGGSGDDLDGDYDLNVTNGTQTATTTVTVDNDDPSSNSYSPSDGTYTNDNSPTVSYSSDGTGSNVIYQDIEVEDSNGNVDASATSNSVDASELDDGTYSVNHNIGDEAGNWNNATDVWEFTVDTSYDVADPSLSWSSTENSDVVQMDGDVDLTIGFDDDEEEPDTVTCYNGDAGDSDNEIEEAEDISDSDNEYKFQCEFSEDDFAGETVDLQLRARDQAGNSRSYDEGEISFDAEEPTISDISTPVSAVTGDFEVEFSATDDIGVEEVEYFYDDSSTLFGEGTSVDADSDSFAAEVGDLESGEHTLYLRASDTVERWSETSALEFSYLPDATPTLEVSAPSNVEVTAGESKEVTATIENTGKIIIEETNVTISGLVSDSATLENMMPGDTEEVSFDVSPGEADIGEKTVTVSTSNPSASAQINVRVLANSEQQTQIESTLTDYETRLEELDSQITSLESQGLDQDLSERLNSNFTDFRSTVQQARTQFDNGQYYQAQSTLEGIESRYSSAEESYETVKKIDSTRQRNAYILGGVAFLILIGFGGAGLYVYRTEATAGDLEHKLGLDNLKEKLKSVTESEPEAEEFEWDGFN